MLLSSQDEWRFRSLVPRPDGTKQTLRASLQHSDAEFAPLALTGDRDALIRLPVWGESNERYLHIQTLVPSVSGWHRHVLAPAGKTIAWATYAAQITTLLAVLLLVGGVTVWRQRHCRAEGVRVQGGQGRQQGVPHARAALRPACRGANAGGSGGSGRRATVC